MHALLANVFELGRELRIEEDYCLAVHHAVLRAAERQHINANIRSDLFQTRIQTHRGIRKTRTIDVQQHPMIVSEPGQRLQLLLRVNSAHFSGLRDRDHSRLHVVFDADAVQQRFDLFDTKLAVRRRNCQQLAAGEILGGATLIDVHVRSLSTNNGLVRFGNCF